MTSKSMMDDDIHTIACSLAELDGYDTNDEKCGLYDLRWSGGPCPEPMGDAWSMDYLPKAEQIVKTLRASASASAPHDLRNDALCDISYRAGLQRGFNLGLGNDSDLLQKELDSRAESLTVLRASRASTKPAVPEGFVLMPILGEAEASKEFCAMIAAHQATTDETK